MTLNWAIFGFVLLWLSWRALTDFRDFREGKARVRIRYFENTIDYDRSTDPVGFWIVTFLQAGLLIFIGCFAFEVLIP